MTNDTTPTRSKAEVEREIADHRHASKKYRKYAEIRDNIIATLEAELAGMESKPEFKVGDEVWVKATVTSEPDENGDYYLDISDAKGCTWEAFTGPQCMVKSDALSAQPSGEAGEVEVDQYTPITTPNKELNALLNAFQHACFNAGAYAVAAGKKGRVPFTKSQHETGQALVSFIARTAPTSPVDAEPVGYAMTEAENYKLWQLIATWCLKDDRTEGVRDAVIAVEDFINQMLAKRTHPAPAVEGKEKYTRIGWALRFLPPHDCDIYFGLDQNEQRIREWCAESNARLDAKSEVVPVYAALLTNATEGKE